MATQQEAAGYYHGRFAEKLVALAATMISRRRIHLCEDVVQATFVEFLGANVRAIARGELCSPDTDSQCWAYLVRILVSKCSELIQDLKAEEAILSNSTGDLSNLTTKCQSPPEAMEQKEQDGQLWQAIRGLGHRDREILLLHVVNGETYRSLAARFDLPRGTVGSIVHGARAKLFTSLHAYFDDCRIEGNCNVRNRRYSFRAESRSS